MRWVAPVVLAVVFAFAGGAKFGDRAATEEGFRALRLPRPDWLAVLVPAAELLTAVLLVATPVGGALLALVLLAAFSVVLWRRLREGSQAPCRCFGGTRTKPISSTDLARNGALTALAVLTLLLPPA